jgi:hypothetical protein
MSKLSKQRLDKVIADWQPSYCVPFLAALAGLLLAGCAVGPDFKRPATPAVGGYTANPLATTVTSTNVAGGEAQRFAQGGDIAGDWWILFHSQPLNELIELALTNNPDLKAAQAALSVARENVLAQRGVYFPSAAGSFSATRQKQPGTLAPVPNSNAFEYNLFTPQVSVSYSPDVFGLNRRTLESVHAQEQAVRFQMIAAYTTLTANVVVTAIQAGAVQAQIDATRQLVDLNSNMVEILLPVDQRLRQPARCGRAGIAACASRRDAAAVAQTSCSTARPAGGLGRAGFQIRHRRINSNWRACNCRWKSR